LKRSYYPNNRVEGLSKPTKPLIRGSKSPRRHECGVVHTWPQLSIQLRTRISLKTWTWLWTTGVYRPRSAYAWSFGTLEVSGWIVHGLVTLGNECLHIHALVRTLAMNLSIS